MCDCTHLAHDGQLQEDIGAILLQSERQAFSVWIISARVTFGNQSDTPMIKANSSESPPILWFLIAKSRLFNNSEVSTAVSVLMMTCDNTLIIINPQFKTGLPDSLIQISIDTIGQC